MGKTNSKPQSVNVDGPANNENINTIIIPNESVQVHNDTHTYLLIVIVSLMVLNTLYKIYKTHQRNQKKKYQSRYEIEKI